MSKETTKSHRYPVVMAVCLVVFSIACGDSETGSSTTITPPTIQSPSNGSSVSDQQPTLVVGNATGASGLVYTFQVATDSGFTSVTVTGGSIPEGAGSTSWQINLPLDVGTTYFWRARASGDGTEGPFSPAASFEVTGGFILTQPQNQMLVFDPLTNGTSVGEVGGGEFRAGGWFTTDATSYIRYEVPTITSGYVEFDATGLRTINPIPNPLKRNLMIMWDPSAGDYTENPFRVHITKFDERLVTRWPVRFRWISAGQESNTGIDLYEWDENRTYHFRLEWGSFPDIVSSQRARVLLDGREILVRNYDPIYRPSTHWIELGMGPRDETLEKVTYSNVMIGIR